MRFWSFVGKKQAMDKFTRWIEDKSYCRSLHYERSKESAEKLWGVSTPGLRQCAVELHVWLFTKKYYQPSGIKAVEESGKTNHIERFNNTRVKEFLV